MADKLAVLGSPIQHSKSPAIHAAAYRVLGLDWVYGRHDVREGGLSHFLETLDSSWHGLSVTMPLKDEAARLATSLDSVAKQTRAVNTLLRTPLGWSGFNTDVFGIVNALRAAQVAKPERILILGSGATATSAMVACSQLAPNSIVAVFARNENSKKALIDFAGELGITAKAATNLKRESARADLVISTLPAKALDEVAHSLSKAWFFKPRGAIFDVVYQGWPTPIAKLWQSKGLRAISGLEMLVWQAVAQIRIFTSGSPSEPLPNEIAVLEAMRHAVSD